MKKLLTLALASFMVFNLVGCRTSSDAGTGSNETYEILTEGTVGEILLSVFKNKNTEDAQAIVDFIQENHLPFMGANMEVEPGLLSGFDNYEVTGFEKGIMFGPAMGTIPFVGYIFELADGADVEAFKTGLKDNANLRWNICTEAEELTVDNVGNKVFFLMSPKAFEE
jgi:hypothetical protein